MFLIFPENINKTRRKTVESEKGDKREELGFEQST